MSTSPHRIQHSIGGFIESIVTLHRRFHPIRTGSIGAVLFLTAASMLFAQEPNPSIPDTTLLPTDSLTLADSLALADTVQPEIRLGFFAGGLATNAAVANIDLNPETRTGLHAGVRAEMEFAYPIYFLVEAEYAEKGVRSSYKLSSGTTVQEDFHLNYLDIPILYRAGIPLGERAVFSAGFGAHIAFLLSRTKIVRIAEVDSASRIEKGLENFDFGLEGRLGGEYRLSPQWSLTADLRYLHGLQNILIVTSKDDNRSWKGRSMFISVGIMYQLQRSIRQANLPDAEEMSSE